MNTPKDSTGGCCPPPPCSVLAGTFDIEAIEQAFFNHDHDGSEPAHGQYEKRRDMWHSFKAYLAAHPRQEISGRDLYKDEMRNNINMEHIYLLRIKGKEKPLPFPYFSQQEAMDARASNPYYSVDQIEILIYKFIVVWDIIE